MTPKETQNTEQTSEGEREIGLQSAAKGRKTQKGAYAVERAKRRMVTTIKGIKRTRLLISGRGNVIIARIKKERKEL